MQSGCRQSRCARSTCTAGRTYGSNATDYVDCWPVWGLMAAPRPSVSPEWLSCSYRVASCSYLGEVSGAQRNPEPPEENHRSRRLEW